MSLGVPVLGTVSYGSGDKMRRCARNGGCQNVSFRASSKSDNNKADKKKFWGKVILGAAATAVVVESVLRHNPVKKQTAKELNEVFKSSQGSREFMMLAPRDEVIISEIAGGNEMARKLLPTVKCDGEGVLKYIDSVKRVDEAKQEFISGRYDFFRVGKLTVEQTQDIFFNKLRAMKEESIGLYQKYLKPLVKY